MGKARSWQRSRGLKRGIMTEGVKLIRHARLASRNAWVRTGIIRAGNSAGTVAAVRQCARRYMCMECRVKYRYNLVIESRYRIRRETGHNGEVWLEDNVYHETPRDGIWHGGMAQARRHVNGAMFSQ